MSSKHDSRLPDGFPPIETAPERVPRPFWSVMIPTSDRFTYLEAAIQSVLKQDPGPDQMQIAVIDNCSTGVDVTEFVNRIAGDRVECFRHPQRVGMAANWNTCVNRAAGKWVHILHDDDEVLDGFYRVLGVGVLSDPRIGAAFCRNIIMDADGNWERFTRLVRTSPGVVSDIVERLAVHCCAFPSATIVRRDVYQELGGYLTDKKMEISADWEMWLRIASRFAIWYEPRPYLLYRAHENSMSVIQVRSGKLLTDRRNYVAFSRCHLPQDMPRKKVTALGRANIRDLAVGIAGRGLRDLRRGRYLRGGVNLMAAARYALSSMFPI